MNQKLVVGYIHPYDVTSLAVTSYLMLSSVVGHVGAEPPALPALQAKIHTLFSCPRFSVAATGSQETSDEAMVFAERQQTEQQNRILMMGFADFASVSPWWITTNHGQW